MRIEHITIALRLRHGWEAVDLGFRMAMYWGAPLWRVWFAVFLPVAIALHWAFHEHPVIATLLVWWLKPLFDRYLLFVLSRAVFGAAPSVGETLRASRSILGSGLALGLITRFLDMRRSFRLPVLQLEQQRGAAARARMRLLAVRSRGVALGLTVLCLHFELVVMIGLEGLAMLFASDVQWQKDISESQYLALAGQYWGLRDALLYLVAVSLIEPLYVAGGFALYLNRRVGLEGWDLELAFKRLRARQRARTENSRAPSPGGTSLLGLLAAVTLISISGLTPSGAHAIPSASADVAEVAAVEHRSVVSRRERVQAVVADPIFGEMRTVKRWQSAESTSDERTTPRNRSGPWLSALGEVLRVLAWLVCAGVVIAMIALLASSRRSTVGETSVALPPARLFGLEIHPDSLPEDVVQAAREALAMGAIRKALSLLYRGCLSQLVFGRALGISAGSTEQDVLRHAQRQGSHDWASFLSQLLPVWIATAYGARTADKAQVLALCDAYAEANQGQQPGPSALQPMSDQPSSTIRVDSSGAALTEPEPRP